MFIPYDGAASARARARLGEPILDTVPVSLFHGCRMTFRTAAVREVGGFEDALIRNSLGEDLDISYRVSQRHPLVLAPQARIYHMKVPLARADNRYKNAALTILNAAALYWLHADPASRRASDVYRFGAERLALELLRDCVKPWRGFPHARGSLHALARLPNILSKEREELRRWYPEVQSDLLG
jgi:GT2 family glycosyltransferase